MEKAECIKQILSDKDLVERVRGWIARREEIQQASVAASSYHSLDLKTFLVAMDDFNQMMQDLNIGSASTASKSRTSRQDKSSAPEDVPTGLNDKDDGDVERKNELQTVMSSISKNTLPPATESMKQASDLTLARSEVDSRAKNAEFNIFNDDQEAEEDLKLKTVNFTPAPKKKACSRDIETEEFDNREQKNLNKQRSQEKEANPLPTAMYTGVMNMTENKDSQNSDHSSLESFRADEDGSHQNSVEYEELQGSTSNMSDSAESNDSPIDQGNLHQSSLVAPGRSRSSGSSSDESPPVRPPSRVLSGHDEPESERATEHASALPGEGSYQSERLSVGAQFSQQHSNVPGPGHRNIGDARQSARFPAQNPSLQRPDIAAALQSAAQNTVGQLQNPNSQQVLNLQNPSQILPETLHAIVMMHERNLMRQGNQPTRCDSCANLQTEIKHLKRNCRCLGQQLELLKWNYIILEEFIKNLEEMFKEKESDNEERLKIILDFHKKLVERKKEIASLKKEIEVMRNKFGEEREKLYKRADKEEKEQTQLFEQMKEQKEMLERVHDKVSAERHERQVLQEKLKQKSEESCDLQEENRLLREENRVLRESLETLKEERRIEREANQVLHDEYTSREAQFNERINLEIQQLMQLFEDLKRVAQRHGYFNSLAGLNFERESDDSSASP